MILGGKLAEETFEEEVPCVVCQVDAWPCVSTASKVCREGTHVVILQWMMKELPQNHLSLRQTPHFVLFVLTIHDLS